MLNGPFPPWPSFTQEEADAVSQVLLSNKVNYWTGPESRAFEKEFAAFAGTDHAIALANGTLALDLALYGLGIGAHNGGSAADEVIVTPRSFMASASSIVNAGARPVFADVDADTQNITGDSVAAVLTPNTRAVLCVHLAGWPCDMDMIRTAVGPDVRLIEDCAQAHGALYKGRSVGGIGDVGAWSFCQDKIMTTGGEGGMVTCSDEALWRKMWAYKDHGKSYEAVFEREHAPGFRWLHESFGTNWRITEMQSAIGRIQLKRLPEWTRRRTENAERLMDAMRPYNAIRLPQLGCDGCPGSAGCHKGCQHAWYKFYAFVRPDNLAEGWTRDRIVSEISARGVPCLQGSCSEMYLEKAFEGSGLRPESARPVARTLGETSIMMLVHPTLQQGDLDKSEAVLHEVLQRASKV